MKFRRLTHISQILILSLLLSVHVSGADNEDANDNFIGAEAITAPATVIAYTITVGDSDWFVITKKKCDNVSITFTPSGDPNDIYSLAVYNPGMGPILETAASNMGNNSINLPYTKEKTTFYVEVHGDDVAGTSSYVLNIQTSSKNAAALAEIELLKKEIKKAKKKLKKTKKRPDTPGRAKRIKKLDKKIKKAKKRVKVLEAGLCS